MQNRKWNKYKPTVKNSVAVFQTVNGSEGLNLHVYDGSISVFCLWVKKISECNTCNSISVYLLNGDIFLTLKYSRVTQITQLLYVL